MSSRALSVSALLAEELSTLAEESIRPFDVHAHTGVDIDGTARTAEEHLAELEEIGARSVVFPLCVNSGYEAENRRVVEESRRSPGELTPFARLDPRVSGEADAQGALAAGAQGFKLHPRGEDFRLEHPNVDAIFSVAAAARAPVLIHAGSGVGSFGPTILELAARHRGCPIVLAHAGISDLAWLWRELPEHPNLFFDTAWLVPADLLAMFALVPPGRILYGSDVPYMDMRLVLAVTLRCARFVGFSAETTALIMGGQLETLLAGEEAIDAGPAPGAPETTLSPSEARVVSLLSGAGGCLFGGGDPSQPLELAQLALAGDAFSGAQQARIAELIQEAGSSPGTAVPAIVLALTLAMTPGADRAVAIA